MLYNYLKIAFRTLLKFKGYASINLVGTCLWSYGWNPHHDLCTR
jgi:hypothetical protein